MPETVTNNFANVRERHAAMELILHDRLIGTEFFNFVCGDLIGTGCYRYVFEYMRDKRFVVKVDMGNVMANNLEWQIWSEVEYIKKLSRWFAPCSTLTTCGRVMLQRRCKPVELNLYPKKVPDFFSDLKWQNWGMLNGNMVCFDYASTKLLDLRTDYKLVTAKWWNG